MAKTKKNFRQAVENAAKKKNKAESIKKKVPSKKEKVKQQLEHTDLYICGKCELILKLSEQSMCCDICQTWCHLSCIGMTSELYKLIKKQSSQVKGLMWLCDRCKPKFDKYVQVNYLKTNEDHNKDASDENEETDTDDINEDVLYFEQKIDEILKQTREKKDGFNGLDDKGENAAKRTKYTSPFSM